MDKTQRWTQSTQGTGTSQQKIGEYAKHLNNVAIKVKNGTAAPTERSKIEKALIALSGNDYQRLRKMFVNLGAESVDDKSSFLSEFAENWFVLVDECDKDNSEIRRVFLAMLLDHLNVPHVSFSAFATIYSIFTSQTEKVTATDLVKLCDSVASKLENDKCTVSAMWSDSIVVVFRRLLELTNIAENKPLSGPEVAASMLHGWLTNCKSSNLFKQLVQIANKSGASHVITRFVAEDVQHALDNFEDLSDADKRVWSLRAIEVMDKGEVEAEKGSRLRIIKALLTVWSVPVYSPSPGAAALSPSAPLTDSVHLMHSFLFNHAPLCKTVLELFKRDSSRFFCSEFGFAALISLVTHDRYRTVVLDKMKKAVSQVYRMEEEAAANGWIKQTFPVLSPSIVQQMNLMASRLSDGGLYSLLSKGLLDVSLSLLETPQGGRPVALSCGRVSSGPPCWMLGASTMSRVIAARPSEVSLGPSLLQLLEAISGTTNTSTALVLIDILVGVVRENAGEVLNHSKLIENIPEYTCRLRRDTAVCLIRALLPIFNQRNQMRAALISVLKRDMLCDRTVTSAVPLLLLLFNSLSRTGNTQSSGDFSQSFATFSSQSLASMGMERESDSPQAQSIVGCLRRCLSQAAPLRSALYRGLAEWNTKGEHIAMPCLDLLLGHVPSLPEWSSSEMVLSTPSITQLKEPLPHFLFAVSALTRKVVAQAAEEASPEADSLVEKAKTLLTDCAKKAAEMDMEDLGLDKLADWSRATQSGRATILFANCMRGVYDALLEYLWMDVAALHDEPCEEQMEWINALLAKRNEVVLLLKEKMVRRKEKTRGVDENQPLETSLCDVPVSISTVAEMLGWMVGAEPRDGINALPLLVWTVDRTLDLSSSIAHSALMPERTPTDSMVTACKHLLSLYTGDCAKWLTSLESCHPLKTTAVQAHCNLLQFLLTRQSKKMEVIATIWQNDSDSSGGNNVALMRHVHMVISRLLPSLLLVEKSGEEKEDKKEEKLQVEKQAKALLKIVEVVMEATTSPKAPSTAFRLLLGKLLQKNSPLSVPVLRDLFRLLRILALRSPPSEDFVDKTMNSLTEQLVAVMADEPLEDTFDCISPLSAAAASEMLMSFVEKCLEGVKSAAAFAPSYSVNEDTLDDVIASLATRSSALTRLTHGLLPLYIRFAFHKDKVTILLTSLFSVLDKVFKLMSECKKTYGNVASWRCVDGLANLVGLLRRLLSQVDEHVGMLSQEDQPRANGKRKYAKTKKEEGIFTRFVRAREEVQSTILLLSTSLKDSRLNMQIKNNSIGQRDFRINLKVLDEKVRRNCELDESLGPSQAKRRKGGEENRAPSSPVY